MLNLVLDTSIYRQNPQLNSSEFTVLSRLAKAEQIRLHVPYVVEREFVTYIEKIHGQRISKAINALSAALVFPSIGSETQTLLKPFSALKTALPQLIVERGNDFVNWLDEIGAVRDSLTIDQALAAMEAYFTGTPPLKQPKVRKDLPDSFIFQAVIALNDQIHEEVGVVVHDNALYSAFSHAGIPCWKSLREFLTSPRGQSLVAQQTIAQFKRKACAYVLSIANSKISEIVIDLELGLLSLVNSSIYGDFLPGENGEINITGVDTPYEIEINNVEYLGDTVFVTEFTALVEMMYEFAFPAFDAFELDTRKYGISTLNDYYVLAETTDTFSLSAALELEFPMWDSEPNTADELNLALREPIMEVKDLHDFKIPYD